MKTILAFLLFAITLPLFSQTELTDLNSDENIRKLHIIKYLDVTMFEYESPEGEAYANLILDNFQRTLQVLDINEIQNDIPSDTDRLIISSLQNELNKVILSEAPSWSDLHKLETYFLITQDKNRTRTSKYKTLRVD